MNRSRGEGSGQHKSMFGIHSGVLLEAKVGGIVSNGPVGFEVAGKLERLAGFIPLAFFGVAVLTLLFQFVLAQRLAGRSNQAGIDGDALIDGKPLFFELAQDFGVDRIHGFFGQAASEAGEGRMVRRGLAEG